MRRQLGVHQLHQVEQITHHLEQVHRLRPHPVFRGDQPLASLGHALAQPLDLFLHITAHRGVVFLRHDQVQVATAGQVQVVHGCQAGGTA